MTMQFIDLAAQQSRLRAELDSAIARVLDHGRYILGPEVAELERALGEFSGAADVVTCSSGTDALVLALMALGVGPGDGVVVPSFTFAATAEAVALLGAVPIFVDVDEQSYCLDVDHVRAALADTRPGARPVGVIAVDLFGQPADYPALRSVADEFGCWVVADAAQSFGATLGGVAVGRLATITTTSFFPAKPLGCYGDGGAVFVTEASDAPLLRSLRVHGSGSDKYDNARIGINGRLDTLQAAILLVKLEVFAAEILERQRIAGVYSAQLAGVVVVPHVEDDRTSAWAQYTVRHRDRDRLADGLREVGVPTAIYYPRPLHLQTAYRDYPRGPEGLSRSERLAAEVLSLPMHPYLTGEDQDRVIDAVRHVVLLDDG